MVFSTAFLSFVTLLAVARAQNVGTNTAENHPKLTTQKCTKSGCTTLQTSITLDSNWRWTHNVGGSTNCYTGNTWDASFCPNPTACATACAIDGADYQGTYGITTNGNSINLKFVTNGPYSTNIGSRVYLLANDNQYQMFKLKNQEFTFDVDTSQLPCGLNGALYFISMDADGGKAKYPGNKAGAKYGTGYCDAQCPRDLKWINGEANVLGWTPSATDPNAGVGQYGTCCPEMDIWEANSISQAVTPHPCTSNTQTRCTGTQCGANSNSRYAGICDPDGGDYATYRLGQKSFYGPGKTVNSNTKLTVVTQFKTSDNTATGALTEIRRLYVQNGKIIQNAKVNVPGIPATTDSITDSFINAAKTAFGDTNSFSSKGGMAGMSKAMDNGMVLALSLWADHTAKMLWLDSNYPTTANPSNPGVARGTCPTSSGVPADLINSVPNASVTYSNIKFGDIGTTYTGTA